MAETAPPETASITQATPQRPWHISPEYDSGKAGEYIAKKEGNYNVFIDPITGREMARILEAAGGAEVKLDLQETPPKWWPFTEKEWTDIDLKDRTVEAAVKTMRHFYDMSNAERAGNAGKFSAAYQDFAEYALGKKLYDGKDTRIIAVELELVNFDGEEIKKYDPVKQGQVIDALNRLDFIEREQAGIENATSEQSKSLYISREERKKYSDRKDKIGTELYAENQTLATLTNPGFVTQRKEKKAAVEKKIGDLKEEIKSKEEEEKKGGVRVDAEQWERDAYKLEKDLEERLLKEKEVAPVLDTSPNNKFISLSVLDISNFIEEKSGESVSDQDKIDLEYAKNTLAGRFQEAKNLGILDDLEERLEGRYQELALALFSQSRTEQGDTDMEARRGSRNLTFSEVREIIAKESDIENPNSLTNTSERSTYWKIFSKFGVAKEDIQNLRGIRGVFVARAYDQMYDSLSRLYKQKILDSQLAEGKITQQKYDNFRILETKRIFGDWDVLKCEGEVRSQLGAEERAQEDKLFYVDRYYLTLTGTTEAQVEQGVNNYLTGLLEGAHVYDVQTIMQKMQYLSAAIMSKKDVLMANGMSASAAQEALTRINILAENRGEFYVMNFAAQNLMMDEYFIPLYEKWGGVIGIEKMKKILDMNNGLVAPAMLLFLDPKNRLLFQPAGFKGQGMKNIWAQRTLRDKIKEQLTEELVNYQAREVKPTELMEQTTWQDFLRMKFEERYKVDEQGKKIAIKPKEVASAVKDAYNAELKRVKEAYEAHKATNEDLESLRRIREEYAKRQNEHERLLVKAKSAIETTWQVLNIFGETARLGAPSIIMDNGDHISIEDATYFYKFAILDAMKKNGDSPARMRWRAYRWTKKPWQYDNNGNPIVKTDPKRDGIDATFNLVKGLEDTGITKEEFQAFMEAAKKLRTNGYKAVLKSSSAEYGVDVEHSFEEIISRNDVRPVRNNFISNYKSSREIFANPTAMREAKKGGQPFIMNILDRLDQSGRGKFTTLDRAKIDGKPLVEVPDERLKEIFEDAITDSFILHITARQLARWEATLQSSVDAQGNISYTDKFSTDRLYYGSQDIPWGVKRLQYLPEYWMTNKRERIGRAWKLLPFIPLLKSGLAQECDAENLPDLIFNVNKEHIDEPGLKQIAAGFKDAQGWRQRGETSVDEQKGETAWSYWDKPTVDSAQIKKVIPNLPLENDKQKSGRRLTMEDYVNATKPEVYMQQHPLYEVFKKELVDVTREILRREAPLNVFLEAQLGYNRSAGGSGIGLEMGERLHYRNLQWWLSTEKSSTRQEQGGLFVNDDAAQFFKFITIKNSWSNGMSILDEAWRQARGTRDAGASDQYPHPIITVS